MQLHLKKFNLDQIGDDKTVVLISSRGGGKSTVIVDLLYHKRDFPIGTVICPTEGSNGSFGRHVPKLFIHTEYSPQLIENVLRRQQKIIKRMEKERQLYGRTSIDPRAFLIMDDMMFDDNWKKDKNVKYIYANGRHEKLLFIVSLQYLKGIPPMFRTNCDYVFIFRESIVANRKLIYDNFAGMFPTYEIFDSVMTQCTENYECLVIDKTTKSNKLEDQVYWYKAELHDDFKVGCREFWLMNNEYAKDSDDEEDDMFDVSKIQKKRNGPTINVKKGY